MAAPEADGIARVKPLLGTLVHIRVEGLSADTATQAIDAAFAEIAALHRLMSFHDANSDLSRLNMEGTRTPVTLDSRTYHVLQTAIDVSRHSDGAFDPCIGDVLVRRGLLPAPQTRLHDAPGDWRCIELLTQNRARLHQPAWIDLGGIAKGYAVDRAIAILARFHPTQACVNAGGDLRVWGGHVERTRLETEMIETDVPVVDLCDESLASSRGAMPDRDARDRTAPHVATHPDYARPLRFASVIAPHCIHADALTKVVMAKGHDAAPLLHRYQAHALMRDHSGWYEIARHI